MKINKLINIFILISVFLPYNLYDFKQSYYYYTKGILNLQQKEFKLAITYLEKTIDEDPDAFYVYPQLIYLYAMEGQKEKLNSLIRKIDTIEIDTTTIYDVANLLLISGYIDTATYLFEKLYSILPENPDILLSLAKLYFNSNPDKALELYSKYIKINSDDDNVYFQMALIEYKRGNTEQAKQYLEKISDFGKEINQILPSSEKLISDATDYSTLIQQYEEHIQNNPNDTKIIGNLFFLLLLQQEIEKARLYLPKLLSISKKEFLPEYNYFIALFYEYTKQYKKAIKFINRYIRSSRVNEIEPYIKLSYYHFLVNDYKKGIKILKETNKKFKSEITKKMLLYSYIDTKNYKDAIEILFELKNSSHSFERINFYIGMCFEQIGKIDDAIPYLREAIKDNPHDHIALNYLGYIYAEKGTNLDEAEILIKKALEFEPTNYAYIDSLAWTYYKKDLYEMAEELFEQIKNHEDHIIYEHIGDVKFKLRKYDQALFFYNKSLKLNPKNKILKKKILEIKTKWKF